MAISIIALSICKNCVDSGVEYTAYSASSALACYLNYPSAEWKTSEEAEQLESVITSKQL